MHARGGRTLARAGAWRGMIHLKHSSGHARTHAGRRPGRGQHADCRRRSLVRGGAVRTRAACTSSVAPRARGGGRLGAAALAQRGELGGACEGRRLRRGCARGAGACVGDARAPAGAAGQALGAAGPCAGGRSRRSGRVRLRAKRSASRRPPVPRRLPPPHRLPHRTPAPAPTPRAARPPPRRPPVRFQRAASAKNKVASSFRAPIPNPRSLVTLAEGVFPESLGELSAGGHCGSRARFWQKRPRRLARSLRGGPEGPAGSFGALRAVPFAASSL